MGTEIPENDLSFRPVKPVNIIVRNLSVTVTSKPSFLSQIIKKNGLQQKKVYILENVSADLPTGQLTALIGASGSGKVEPINIHLIIYHAYVL